MSKIRFAYILAFVFVLLLLFNIIISYPDKFDNGFWLRSLSNILLIGSMIISIRDIKKQNSESD